MYATFSRTHSPSSALHNRVCRPRLIASVNKIPQLLSVGDVHGVWMMGGRGGLYTVNPKASSQDSTLAPVSHSATGPNRHRGRSSDFKSETPQGFSLPGVHQEEGSWFRNVFKGAFGIYFLCVFLVVNNENNHFESVTIISHQNPNGTTVSLRRHNRC